MKYAVCGTNCPGYLAFSGTYLKPQGLYCWQKPMSTPAAVKPAKDAVPQIAPQDQVIPALFGEGEGLYPQRKDTFVYSFVIHMLVVVLLIWSGHWALEHKDQIKQQAGLLITDI